jgi:hypothetical protein
MACINPDGVLTGSARDLLKIIGKPLTPEEISRQFGQPVFKTRSSLRDMADAGFDREEGGRYTITEKGKEKL